MKRVALPTILKVSAGALLLTCALWGPSLLPAPRAATAPAAPASGEVDNISYGGRGADPVPLQATPVRLRAAEVLLKQVPAQDGWQVTASYELVNPGGAPVAVPVVLPDERCPPRRACTATAGLLQDLGLRLGDRLLDPVATPSPAAAPLLRAFAEAPGPGIQYLLSVPPQRSTPLKVEYRFDQSRGRHAGVRVASSAGRWGGPIDDRGAAALAIERLRYTIELAQPALYVIYPRAFTLAEFRERPAEDGAGAVIRLVFTAQGLAARGDFEAFFPGDAVDGAGAAGPCDGFRGDRAEADLQALLRRFPPARLRACKEQVLSLHGYPFKDPAQRSRHYAKPALPAWAAGRDLAIAARPENAEYRDSLLSPGEQAYLQALDQALSQAPGAGPGKKAPAKR